MRMERGGALADLTNIGAHLKEQSQARAAHAQAAPSSSGAGSSPGGEDYLQEWSAPCAVQAFGCSYGLLVGCEICDYVLFLNSDEAVSVFATSSTQFSLGAGLDVTVGMVGR